MQLGRELRGGSSRFLKRRRNIVGLAFFSSAVLGGIALYQMGILKKLPGPRWRGFDAEKVNGSAEAYSILAIPDALTWIDELRSDRLPGRDGSEEPLANASVDADRHGRETSCRCRARGEAHRRRLQEIPGSLRVVAPDSGGDIYGSPARNSGSKSGSSLLDGRRPWPIIRQRREVRMEVLTPEVLSARLERGAGGDRSRHPGRPLSALVGADCRPVERAERPRSHVRALPRQLQPPRHVHAGDSERGAGRRRVVGLFQQARRANGSTGHLGSYTRRQRGGLLLPCSRNPSQARWMAAAHRQHGYGSARVCSTAVWRQRIPRLSRLLSSPRRAGQ